MPCSAMISSAQITRSISERSSAQVDDLPADLPKDLKTFWHRSINTEDVDVDTFIREATRHLGDGRVGALAEAVKERIRNAVLNKTDAQQRSELQRLQQLDADKLLAHLLRRYLDPDGNGKVHTSEYLGFYRRLYTGFTPGSRQWVFDAYAQWLKEESSRAMVVYGGPGLGKTTIAAAFACKAAFRTTEGEVIGSDVVGHFFFQHFEKKSSTPVALLRTLAYQLALALPPLRPVMMKLNRVELRNLNDDDDVDTAFQTLLLRPLKAIEADLKSLKRPLVIVIDALDESSEHVKLLHLLEYFKDLPKCVRFVVTSRPEERIEKKLSRVFEKTLVIRSDDKHHMEDLKLFIRDQLVTAVIKSAPAGGAPGRSDLLDAATQLLLDKSEGSFVYVARVLKNLTLGDSWSLDDLKQLPDGLDESYSKDFEKMCIKKEGFQESPMARMLQVLLAVQTPPSLELLAAAWYCSGGEGRAAQLPGPGAMRTAVHGIKGFLVTLGSLYSVHRDTVTVFHKSFHDWISTVELPNRKHNEFWVDPLPGHRALANLARPYMADQEAARGAWHTSSAGGLDALQVAVVSYTLQYGPHHLVELANMLDSADSSTALQALSMAVANYPYLAAVFGCGHGHALITALLKLRPAPPSGPLADGLRWLLTRQKELLSVKSEEDVVASALRCPIRTLAYGAAWQHYARSRLQAGRVAWRVRHTLGGPTTWPPLRVEMTLIGDWTWDHRDTVVG
ncbi:hypothetical protein GPECTOR_48g436 [Gonium pectorale]|uniref:NACHT domain-containing protein n=1 Tax=Gonium pectorale TaxID=33097 RepID=A0A150G848_GONPE|nr:hypothetical protein GPECTOR_48g436 [Gonium pectorale]|eukprot:KXZ46004.1 hypothetical protein GPECTOR_48g436 [Gonium pectorale]